MHATGDDGGTPGSITIDTNGVLSGYHGISARNEGTGAVSVTANGNVTGTTYEGISARNFAAGSTTLSVTTAAGTAVYGATTGILVNNTGSGTASVTAYGDVSAGTLWGIGAFTAASSTGDLTVTTATGTTISGGTHAIFADNYGTGALSITVNGYATGASGGDGILARN